MCSFLNESLATEVINNSFLARWLRTAPAHELKTFDNEPMPVIGMMQAPIESNGWRIEEAEFVVVKDGLRPLIGRDLFDELGISITQTLCSNEGSTVNTITTQCSFKSRIANQFPQHLLHVLADQKSTLSNLNFTNQTMFKPNIKMLEEYPLNYKTELIMKLKSFLK